MFRRTLESACGVAILLIAAAAGSGQSNNAGPYRDPRARTLEYNGPGRDEAEPRDVREVRIGYFGPADVSHPEGGEMWAGASMALDEANAGGGYRGVPFRLDPAWTDDPWRGGVAKLARLTYDDAVWAIIGGIDGATTHLAEQLLPKALLPLVNPVAADRSIHAAGVPWVFSCAPGDHLQAAAIVDRLKAKGESFAIISATDHDSRAFAKQMNLAMVRQRLSPALHVEWEGRDEDVEGVVRPIASADVRAVVVIAPARGATGIVTALRKSGYTGRVYGGMSIARVSAPLHGVIFPSPGDLKRDFTVRFRTRYGREPDYTAAYGYDAVQIVVAAVRRAGLNRARIRDEIRALSPIQGVAGVIEWDPAGQNRRAVNLVEAP